jgi:Skp family chaperone for outer membrane proteins
MVNEAVAKFDSLIKPFEDKFLEYLEGKSNTDHSHSEFEEIREEIEENEKELEEKLGKKADINHTHKIDDIESLTDMLNKKADKEHNHDNYATREELNFLSMQRAR